MNSLSPINLEHSLLGNIVDSWYGKMRDDYRINRYFYDRPVAVQAAALKHLLTALVHNPNETPKKLSELADEAFSAAFARGNAKPSLVNNRDFAFLGTLMNGDIFGDDDGLPRLTMLCPGHSHFLRLNPIDDVYDVALILLQTSLDELHVPKDAASQLLALVASGKEGVMGRGKPIYDEDNSSRFRTHG